MDHLKVSLVLLLCLGVQSGPDVQLADFQDLFRLATAGMAGREDRSLLNTYPFNHVASQTPEGSHKASSHHLHPSSSSAGSAQHQPALQSQIQTGGPASTFHLGHQSPLAGYEHSLTQHTSSLATQYSPQPAQAQYAPAPSFTQYAQPQAQYVQSQAQFAQSQAQYVQPQAQYAQSKAQYAQPQAKYAQPQTQNAQPQAQYAQTQYSPAPAHPQYASAPVPALLQVAGSAPGQYSNFPPASQVSPSLSVTDDSIIVTDLSLPRVSTQCPAAPSLPLQQCQGAVNACWSVGVADVDCPGQGLCCFDGCANVCAGQVRAVVRPALQTLPARRNPAQKRRKPAGEVFRDVAAAGQKCIDKIEQVEEIEYDEIEECDHSYDKKCHTSYSTEYDTQQEEECEDNYKKECAITYQPQAMNVTVRVCMTPLVKDCNLSGPEVCRTEYISECWTKNDPHIVTDDVPKCRTEYEEKCVDKQSGYVTEQECTKWPREVCTVQKELKAKFNPVTKCEKVPQELCGPSGCGFVPGPEECHDQTKTVVTDIPSEECDLQPQRKCAHVTKLVPKLTPVEECVDVPKEVCHRTKGNPRTVLKPVTKKWCYTPSEESGLV